MNNVKHAKPRHEMVADDKRNCGGILSQALTEMEHDVVESPCNRNAPQETVKGTNFEVAKDDFCNLQRLASVGSVVARVAHEIKNRLAIIGGFALRIHVKPKHTEKVKEYSAIICEEVGKLESLLGSLGDFARPVPASRKTESLNALVNQIMDRLHPAIPPHIKIELDLEPSTPKVQVDELKMEQVITNLVQNSIEAMKENGTIKVSTHPRREGAAVVVEDDGPGISGNIRQRIFEPFFSTKIGSNGLGLAICRQILDEQGHTMKLESVPGAGTRFIIEILNERNIPKNSLPHGQKLRTLASGVNLSSPAAEYKKEGGI